MTRKVPGKALLLIALFVLLFLTVRLLPVVSWLESLVDWVASTGYIGLAVFALVYILAAVLLMPGSVLTVGAGAVFGLVWGMVAVSVGSTLGAGAAFLIGRYLARDRVAGWAASRPKFAALDAAVGREGGRIVLLTRLSPVFPYNLLNYLFGLTGVGFWPFLLASWIGMLPGTLLYVYLGFAGRTAAEAAAQGSGRRGGELAFWAVGLGATILLTYYLTRLAKKALAERTN